MSFFEFAQYDELKAYWKSDSRHLDHAAVESWKATFEEFGLLYVLTGSNQISITPAGHQIREAAERGDKAEYAWIGLNLLLRYPLRGARGSRRGAHKDSDLLLYRFLYAALLDLDGYIWWSELERILCRVFQSTEALDAIADIQMLRDNPELLSKVQLPVPQTKGGFYNSLNQVAGHAGMNHFLLGQENTESPPYGVTERKRRHFIRKEWQGLIRRALSNNLSTDQCASGGSAIARLPSAPVLPDEHSYFAYLGATVPAMSLSVTSPISAIELQGERVFILSSGTHYNVQSETIIFGPVLALCQLAKGQRIVLSHDERWTYLVQAKELIDANSVRVQVRRARPITNIAVIRSLQGEASA